MNYAIGLSFSKLNGASVDSAGTSIGIDSAEHSTRTINDYEQRRMEGKLDIIARQKQTETNNKIYYTK